VIEICTLGALIALVLHEFDTFHEDAKLFNNFGVRVFSLLGQILLENALHSLFALF
jgi:hypothetical protein